MTHPLWAAAYILAVPLLHSFAIRLLRAIIKKLAQVYRLSSTTPHRQVATSAP